LDIAGIEQCDSNLFDAGFREGGKLSRPQNLALAENGAAPAQRMGQDAAARGCALYLAEPQASAAWSLRPRMAATISAMIETAISPGDSAPIGRPTGA